MAGIDLSARFEKIFDKTKIVTDKLKAARQGTNEQLEIDAAKAREKASAAADQFKTRKAPHRVRHRRSGRRSAAGGRPMAPTSGHAWTKRHTSSRKTMPR